MWLTVTTYASVYVCKLVLADAAPCVRLFQHLIFFQCNVSVCTWDISVGDSIYTATSPYRQSGQQNRWFSSGRTPPSQNGFTAMGTTGSCCLQSCHELLTGGTSQPAQSPSGEAHAELLLHTAAVELHPQVKAWRCVSAINTIYDDSRGYLT